MSWYFLGSGDGHVCELVELDRRPDSRSIGRSVSGAYGTREEAIGKCAVLDPACSVCGGLISLRYMEPYKSLLRQRRLCFSCNFWTDVIHTRPLVIDGHAYSVSPEKEDKDWSGFGGRKFLIETDAGRKIETTNLWHRGKISKWFVGQLPDNARFVRSDEEATQKDRAAEVEGRAGQAGEGLREEA